MALPQQYQWLQNEPGPRILQEMLKLYNTEERAGYVNNPVIMSWAKEIGIKEYTADSIPWCGLAVAISAVRASKVIPKTPLWALSWGQFGVAADVPMLGDVLVFKREGGGHVGLYVGEDSQAYHVLGGNQGDKVCIIRIAKSRLFAARRCIYTNRPANVRVVKLAANGILSKNEA